MQYGMRATRRLTESIRVQGSKEFADTPIHAHRLQLKNSPKVAPLSAWRPRDRWCGILLLLERTLPDPLTLLRLQGMALTLTLMMNGTRFMAPLYVSSEPLDVTATPHEDCARPHVHLL